MIVILVVTVAVVGEVEVDAGVDVEAQDFAACD